MRRKPTDEMYGIRPDHQAFHDDESDVRSAVNKRKARLRAKVGALPSLKDE